MKRFSEMEKLNSTTKGRPQTSMTQPLNTKRYTFACANKRVLDLRVFTVETVRQCKLIVEALERTHKDLVCFPSIMLCVVSRIPYNPLNNISHHRNRQPPTQPPRRLLRAVADFLYVFFSNIIFYRI